MCGGRIYEIEPDEERQFEGFVAYHALHQVQTGLVEVVVEEEVAGEVTPNNLREMKWNELLKEAGRYAWFKPGMNRQEIEEAIENERRPREKTEEVRTAPSAKKTKGSK